MKKIVCLSVVLAMILACSIVGVQADNQCEVRIRVVYKNQYKDAECDIEVYHIESNDIHSAVLGGFSDTLLCPKCEGTYMLDPGFYYVKAVTLNILDEAGGLSDVFEVKGDKMTVYVPCSAVYVPDDCSDIFTDVSFEEIPMPDNPIVYGECSDDFGWWAWDAKWDAIESSIAAQEKSSESSTASSTEPVESSEVEESNTKSTAESIVESSVESTVESETSKEPTSKKIGNIIFYSILGLVIVVAGVGLWVIRKRRNA